MFKATVYDYHDVIDFAITAIEGKEEKVYYHAGLNTDILVKILLKKLPNGRVSITTDEKTTEYSLTELKKELNK